MFKIIKALENAQIPAPNKNTETFSIVRWGKNNRYWLKKFEGGYVFGDFVSGVNSHVFDKNEDEYSKSELQKIRKSMQKAREEGEREQEKIRENAASTAKSIWEKAKNTVKHAYLSMKGVSSHGLKEYKNCLLIPLFDEAGKLWSLQFITQEAQKRFLSGGRKQGCYFVIGSLENAENAFICEGYATGATIHECSNIPVVIAFDAGNLKSVAEAIRNKYSELKITICADNDCYHENDVNPGVKKAQEAALFIGTQVIIPEFKDISTHPTDFNDLLILEGKDAVKEILEKALKESNGEELSTIPEGFALSDDGLFCIDKKTQNLTRISNYIRVIAFTRSTDEVSRLVEFRDYKGDLHDLVVKPQMCAKDGEQLRLKLLGRGFMFSGSALSKRKLFEYIMGSIPTKEVSIISRTGFSENVYVRPDCVIGKCDDEIILDTTIQDDSYGISGTLQQWNDLVARRCVGNSRLIFAISTAFASILLEPCGMPNFGFHFVGNSSSGKTTSLSVAASVFGKPNYLVSWKATDNAMENMAFRRNDSLLILDELSEISSSKAGDVAYMLANGQGKKRLDKNCNARETLSWRLIFLSSGEVDLSSHMAEDSKTSKAGQKIRLLNISAKASKESNGIFEHLMGFRDGAEFSNYLRENASKYYGTASIEFIKEVLEHRDLIKNCYKDEFKRLKLQYLPDKAEGQDIRAFEHFMFVGFAGELAIKYGVICWQPGTAYQAAVACFNSWLEDKEGVGDDEDRQILAQAKAFFELHAHSRYGDYRQQKWTPDGNKKVYVISGNILLG